jgi:hypothetical protein
MQLRTLSALLTLLVVTLGSRAEDRKITIVVEAGKHDREKTVVCVPLSLPKTLAEKQDVVLHYVEDEKVKQLIGQFLSPGLLTEGVKPSEGEVRRDLYFIIPALKSGNSLTFTWDPQDGTASRDSFKWTQQKGEYEELSFSRLPGGHVLRYMNAPFDDSTKEKREATFKVYHHLFDPSGKDLITKGPGGLYTHHRGLFYGFKATYGPEGKHITADTWHCPPPSGDPKKPSLEAHLEHEKVLSSEAGALLGRHRVQIGWFGRDKERFAVEERELTVYRPAKGLMVDFVSKLTPVKGTVKLDGDPQHAGFHFRASDEVAVAAKDKKSGTYFLRPDGKGEVEKERNWPGDKSMVNLPWNAMSFVVGGKRYTATYLDRPTNPKEARYSERTYGRFGSYFVAECSETKPLTVAYRIWLQEGEMTGFAVQEKSADFVDPPKVSVK